MNENRTVSPYDKLIFERSRPGREAFPLPACDVPQQALDELLPAELLRDTPLGLPEVSEVDVVRHYTALSKKNYGVDDGFYPLGSCTMKYNPKMNEEAAALGGFRNVHPLQPAETVQGCLELLSETERMLCAVTGMARMSLAPAAGAHGELTGLMIIKAWHQSRGEDARRTILVPDSAHGTNPASAASAGFVVKQVKSDARGNVDLDDLRRLAGPDTAGLMLTNPNTLGFFDDHILEIAAVIHDAGGLLYYDGANLNAIAGVCRPGDMGFDVVHLNLHKTFSAPHGGGGPGSGPVGVCEPLVPFLPAPTVKEQNGVYRLAGAGPLSIGRVKSFYGNFGVVVRAYAYLRSLGAQGLREVAQNAVLNANYIRKALEEDYDLPCGRPCMHEVVISAARQKALGVSALDIAKRLIDYGFHPPTIYFPLIVHEAMMIEPTETESRETLDDFIHAMKQIAREAQTEPELLHGAPHGSPVRRPDEVTAARHPVLRYQPLPGGGKQ